MIGESQGQKPMDRDHGVVDHCHGKDDQQKDAKEGCATVAQRNRR